MDRATKAIKRGSIRLKSYSEINLVVCDLNEMRSCGKSSIKAYQTFIEDLLKWAHQESNDSMKSSFALLTELTMLWTEIHNEFFDNLKKFRQQFELILESEQAIDKARNNVANCEQFESKLSKDLEKATTRSFRSDVAKIEDKLREAKRASDIAKVEVRQKENENKVVKIIRIKEGLKKLTESHVKLSQKSNVVMQAQKVVVNELPDEADVSRELQFTSECKVKHAIAKAKTMIQAMSCSSNAAEANAPTEYDAPPPYSPYFGTASNLNYNRNSFPASPPSTSYTQQRPEPSSGLAGWWQQMNPGRRLIDHSGCSNEPKMYMCCRCSAQMISDHTYVAATDMPSMSAEMQLIANVQGLRTE